MFGAVTNLYNTPDGLLEVQTKPLRELIVRQILFASSPQIRRRTPVSCICVLLLAGCGSSLPVVGLDPKFDVGRVKTIGTYVHPTGLTKLDELYWNLVRLDLGRRGYNVIRLHRADVSTTGEPWAGHSEVVREILPHALGSRCELIIVAKNNWSLLPVYWPAKEDHVSYQKDILRMESELTMFDVQTNRFVCGLEAKDTTRVFTEGSHELLKYMEPERVLIMRNLNGMLGRIPVRDSTSTVSVSRRFPIVFYVDRSYRESFPRQWKERIERRLFYANGFFREQFSMEFHAAGFVEWDEEFDLNLHNQLRKLQRVTPRDTSAFFIGVTLDRNLARNWMHRTNVGLAEVLGTRAVVTGTPAFPDVASWNSLEESLTLVHEIGHLFGASHIRDWKSVMSEEGGWMSYSFDSFTRRIVSTTSADFFDVSQGDRARKHLRTIAEVYDNQPTPLVDIVRMLGEYAEIYVNYRKRTSIPDEAVLLDLLAIVQDSSLRAALHGMVAFRSQRWEEAVGHFSASLAMRPDFAEVYEYLASAYAMLGDKQKQNECRRLAIDKGRYWLAKE